MSKVVLHSDPESMGGVVRFPNTRVPVSYLFDYIVEGENLESFCRSYPRVRREDCLGVLNAARDFVESKRRDLTAAKDAARP